MRKRGEKVGERRKGGSERGLEGEKVMEIRRERGNYKRSEGRRE